MTFKDTNDLLSRLLSWNGCIKHDDEMMKFLYYLIFTNQRDLTFFSFKTFVFYYKKKLSFLPQEYPLSCSVPFPFLASFFFGEVT